MRLAGFSKCQACEPARAWKRLLSLLGQYRLPGLFCVQCCCLCGHGNLRLRGMALRRFHPSYKAECSSGCSLPWQPDSLLYPSCKKIVMLLRQPNLLTAFVFDTAAARKEKHIAVISLMQSGEVHLQNQDFHCQA